MLLGWVVIWLYVLPYVGMLVGGLWAIAVLMRVFEEVDRIGRLQALGLAVALGILAEGGQRRIQLVASDADVLLGSVVSVLDGLHDGGLVPPQRLDAEAGDELQIVQSAEVAGVHHGYLEDRAGAAQGQSLVLARDFERDRFDDLGVDRVVGGIKRRHLLALGGYSRQD